MAFWLINESSQDGPVEALELALKDATESVQGCPHSDIIVNDIKKLAKGWRAELSVTAAGHRKKPKKAPSVAPLPSQQAQEEADKKHEKERLDQHKLEVDQFYHDWLVNELGAEYIAMQQADEAMILIAQLSLEEEVLQAAVQYQFTAIHFVPEGSLWELAKSRQPDVDMYEAAHQNEAQNEPAPAQDTGSAGPKPRPGKRSVLAAELTDE